jgi:hypothetical protein
MFSAKLLYFYYHSEQIMLVDVFFYSSIKMVLYTHKALIVSTDTGSVVCLTTKGRQLERNFEELKPASHVPILGTILNIFDVFVAVFFSPLNSLNLVKRLKDPDVVVFFRP